MLYRTETFKDRIGAAPYGELGVDDHREFEQGRKMPIVDPETPKELPNPFGRIEFGGVRRQEEEGEVRFLGAAPFGMKEGMMVFGIVDNDDDATTGFGADPAESAQEAPTGLSIKMPLGLGAAEFPIPESDRSEVADAFSGRRVDEHWVTDLGRYPHPTATSVLLEMDLVHSPQINTWIARQFAEFFLQRPADEDLISPPGDGVCATEIPIAEKAAGIVSPSSSLRAAFAETPIAEAHPKAELEGRNLPANAAEPPLPAPVLSRSAEQADQSAPCRLARQIRRPRTDAPNTPPCEANRRAHPQPCDSSYPGQQATTHVVGDRTGSPGCAGSRPATRRPSLRGRISSVASSPASVSQLFVMRNNL